MTNVARLVAAIDADLSGLHSGVNKARQTLGQFAQTGAASLGQVEQKASGLGQTMLGVFGGNLLTGAFSALTSGVMGAGSAIIDFSSRLEQNRIAFTSMLGSAEAAGSFLQQLQQFAVATPFEFPQLADAAKKMLAFGISANDVIPTLTAVGNAVSAVGGGQQGIDRVTLALGQMSAKGKVQAEEMMQLTEQGIPAWDMLAQKLGVDVATAMDRVTKRQVDAKTMMDAFTEGTAARYGDMMAQQALTFEGATSTIKDSLLQLGSTAFAPLFEALSQGAIALAAFLQTEQFGQFAEAVAAGIGSAIQWVKDLYGVLTSTGGDRAGFLAALGIDPEMATQVGAYLDEAQKAIQRFVEAVGQLLNGDVSGAVDGFGAAFGRITEVAADIGGRLLSWIGEQAAPLLAQLQVWGQQFLEWLGPRIVPMLDEAQKLGLALLSWIGEQVGTITGKLLDWGTAFVKWVAPQIPPLLTALGSLLVEVAGWILGTALPRLTENLLKWGKAFVEWVAVHVPPLLTALGELQTALVGWVTGTALPAIVQALLQWGRAFAEWVASTAWPQLSSALAGLLGQITGWIGSAATSIASAAVAMGQSLMQGMMNGVQSMVGQLQGAIQRAAQGALDAAKNALGIHSPSIEFYAIGVQVVQGFVEGVQKTTPQAVAAVKGMADAVKEAAEIEFASLFPSMGKPNTTNLFDRQKLLRENYSVDQALGVIAAMDPFSQLAGFAGGQGRGRPDENAVYQALYALLFGSRRVPGGMLPDENPLLAEPRGLTWGGTGTGVGAPTISVTVLLDGHAVGNAVAGATLGALDRNTGLLV